MSVISGESKFGLDIGATTGGVLVWDVFAPEEGPKRGALAGNYEGVGASATVGVGLGANALVGEHFMLSAGQFDVALADGMREPLGSTVQTLCGR
jgi:hypothetical protein